MKTPANYAWSIGAAIIPLALALAGTWALYEFAGIGVPRNFYDLIRSEESLFQETYTGNTTGPAPALYAPRWAGSEDDPLTMLLIGTSPSMHAVLPGEADTLEDELNLNFYNVARSNLQFYRFYGELRILSSLTDIDVVLLEYSLSMSSDHRLTYKYNTDSWKRVVLDEEIYNAISALRYVWKGEINLPYVESPEGYERMYEKTKSLWLEIAANADDPRVKLMKVGKYKSAAGRRIKRHGTSDVSIKDVDLLRTNYVALTILERIYAFCVENQIALIIYVPSLSSEVTASTDMPMSDAQMQYSRSALQYFSRHHGVKVFDYYDRYDTLMLFNDPIHIHREPARRFSQELFRDLAEFMAAETKDYSYDYWRDAEP